MAFEPMFPNTDIPKYRLLGTWTFHTKTFQTMGEVVLRILLAYFCLVTTIANAVESAIPERVEFSRDVRPILADNCFPCHGPDARHRKADLRLDREEHAAAREAIVPGRPEASLVVSRIFSDNPDERMPPADSKKSLSDRDKEILKLWIGQGARYEAHWAYQPPRRVEPPEIAGVLNPIDRFVQTRLNREGLAPSHRASHEVLIRRLSLDLTGLPPSIAELNEYLDAARQSPETAYRELVERLLASPHYGERWGRWWLDQARYADSNGYSVDAPRSIWAYRDWVTRALNVDMPFDRFTVEQIAGDLLPEAGESQRIATGFHRNTQINQEGGIDPEQFRIDSVFDRVATTGTVWLGLSIGCAQCHDHKFDAISQAEYYRFFAFFNNQDEPALKFLGSGADISAVTAELKSVEAELEVLIAQRLEQLVAWESGLQDADRDKLAAPVKAALAVEFEKRSHAQRRLLYAADIGMRDDNFMQLHSRFLVLEKQIAAAPTTLVLQERTEPRKTNIFVKGDFTRPADEVSSGTPALLHMFTNRTGNANRLDLANWLVHQDNPLTARVIVNRIWQQYFGRGIVETENDFGAQGMLPSHPELLDWLAVEFMQRGWRMKELHRLIVLSHAYQQASEERDDLNEKDPHNFLVGRQRRIRLDAEIIRDVCLKASGLLSAKFGGPPVYPPIPDGVMSVGQVKHAWNVSQGEDRYRRGLYTFVFRASPPPALSVFDAPDGYSSCTRRLRSNTPLQALTLLNDATSIEFATALAKIVLDEGVEIAFRRCTSRFPTAEELTLLNALDAQSIARVLLNLDETITRE